jgi:signal peptidase
VKTLDTKNLQDASDVQTIGEIRVALRQAPEKPNKKAARKRGKIIFRVIGNAIFAVVLVCVALMAFFMIRSKVAGTPPMIFGHYAFIVLSGSMEPTIHTGGVVFVEPVKPDALKVGDIVTFSGFAGSSALTTHRVVEIKQDDNNGLLILTKGDANEDPDPNLIPAGNVIGRATGSAPLLGYLMSFVQTRQGLMLFILVPAALLVLYEVVTYVRKRGVKDDVKDEKQK